MFLNKFIFKRRPAAVFFLMLHIDTVSVHARHFSLYCSGLNVQKNICVHVCMHIVFIRIHWTYEKLIPRSAGDIRLSKAGRCKFKSHVAVTPPLVQLIEICVSIILTEMEFVNPRFTLPISSSLKYLVSCRQT